MYIKDTHRMSISQIFGLEFQFMYHHQWQETWQDKGKWVWVTMNIFLKSAIKLLVMSLMLF